MKTDAGIELGGGGSQLLSTFPEMSSNLKSEMNTNPKFDRSSINRADNSVNKGIQAGSEEKLSMEVSPLQVYINKFDHILSFDYILNQCYSNKDQHSLQISKSSLSKWNMFSQIPKTTLYSIVANEVLQNIKKMPPIKKLSSSTVNTDESPRYLDSVVENRWYGPFGQLQEEEVIPSILWIK